MTGAPVDRVEAICSSSRTQDGARASVAANSQADACSVSSQCVARRVCVPCRFVSYRIVSGCVSRQYRKWEGEDKQVVVNGMS